jgi:hypothetical protein
MGQVIQFETQCWQLGGALATACSAVFEKCAITGLCDTWQQL